MIKLNRCLFALTLVLGLGTQSTFAANAESEMTSPAKQVIYPINGGSGFVFKQLKSVSDVNSLAYDMIIVDSSRALSKGQIKQVQDSLEKGIPVVIDAKKGESTAKKLAEDLVGFGITADALMVVKNESSKGGYNITPIDHVEPVASKGKKTKNSTFENSKVVDKGEEITSNTVNNIFGL